MRSKEFISESNSIKLKNLCLIKTNFPDADFWLIRKGSMNTVGAPTKDFYEENIGIKVTATNVLDPKYLYYVMSSLHSSGYWKQFAKGITNLVNITTQDVRDIPVGQRPSNMITEENIINEVPLPPDWDPEKLNLRQKFKDRLKYALDRAKRIGEVKVSI